MAKNSFNESELTDQELESLYFEITHADESKSVARDVRGAREALDLIARVRAVEQNETAKNTETAHDHFGSGTSDGSSPDLPEFIGRFALKKPIGSGGFGVVFLAHDPNLERDVALKIPRPEAITTPDLKARYIHEGKAAAALSHPNIVPVYESGQIGSICYLASEFVDGQTLAEWAVNQDPLSPLLAAEICQAIAEGVAHAHQRGILHRDIKPGNILIAKPSADGDSSDSLSSRIQITDFGLAKSIGDDSNLTQTGTLIGTPSYMSPEQAAQKPAIKSSDVYSAGAVLYFLLTGQPPFQNENILATIQDVIQQEPTAPSKLNSSVPADLEAICLKCLEKNPSSRYSSAFEFQADLNRFRNDEPVIASPPSSLDRLRKFARRNKVGVAAGSAVFLALLIATVVSAVMANLAFQSKEKAQFAYSKEQQKTRMLEIAREQTNQQFEKSLEILNEVMIDVGKSGLDDMPRMQHLRRDVLENAAARYESMIAEIQWEGERHFKLMIDYAGLLHSLGSMRRWVGANQEAVEAYEKADSSLAELEKNFPDQRADINVSRAALHYGKAMALRDIAGHFDEAEKTLRQAIQYAKLATEQRPAQANFELCRSLAQLGYLLAPTNRWKEADPIFREAVKFGSESTQDVPVDFKINHEFARAMHNLANYLRHTQKPDESEMYFRKALSIYHELLSHEEANSGTKSSLAATASDFAILLDSLKKPENAAELRAESLALSRELATDFPSIAHFQRGLAIRLGNDGLADVIRGDHEKGRQKYRESEEILKTLIAQVPENLEYQATLANQLSNHGRSYLIDGDRESAERHIEQSAKQWRILAEKQPDIGQYKSKLGYALYTQADCNRISGNYQRAIELCKEALGYFDAASKDPNSAEIAIYKAEVWYLLSLIEGAYLGNEKPAIEHSLKSIEFIKLAKGNPSLAYRAYCRLLVSSLDKSLLDPEKAIELSKYFTEDLPDAPSHFILGVAQFRNGDFVAAQATLNRSRELETEPSIWTQFYLAMTLHNLKKEEAQMEFVKAQELMQAYDFNSSPNHDSHRLRLLAKEAAKLLTDQPRDP